MNAFFPYVPDKGNMNESPDVIFDKSSRQIKKCRDRVQSFMENNNWNSIPPELFQEWMAYFASNRDWLTERRSLQIQEEADPVKDTFGMRVFELVSVLNYVRRYTKLQQEQQALLTIDPENLTRSYYDCILSLNDCKHPLWIRVRDSYDCLSLYKDKNDPPSEEVVEQLAKIKQLWETPIYKYKQDQLVLLMMFLTQQINDVTTDGLAEFVRVAGIVWLRVGEMFACENEPGELNVPGFGAGGYVTRDFYAFCSFYLGEVIRRIHMYDMLKPNIRKTSVDLAAKTKQWIARHVVGVITEQPFAEMYQNKVLPVAYKFPGDDDWYKYFFEGKVWSRYACIDKLRPHLWKRFHSEDQMTKEIVMRTTDTNFASRLFILYAVDEIFNQTFERCHWLNAVVIEFDGIEWAMEVIMRQQFPLLVQVISGFWVLDKGLIYPTDDIFAAIGLWFYLLYNDYGCVLNSVNLESFWRQI